MLVFPRLGDVAALIEALNAVSIALLREIEMTSTTSHDADLRAVARAYIEQREDGALDYLAFIAAVDAYRKRHPETTNGDAALIVSNLMQEMPRAGYP